jgi:hypothetical protein
MKISGPTVLVIHPLPRAREMGSSGKNVCFLVAGLAYTLLFFFFFFFVFVFQGFSYVLHEGECCGRCLPSACKVVAGSLRGDSHSSWKSVGLGHREEGEEGSALQPGSPFCSSNYEYSPALIVCFLYRECKQLLV